MTSQLLTDEYENDHRNREDWATAFDEGLGPPVEALAHAVVDTFLYYFAHLILNYSILI